jgi:glycosyltransferase involved in cell wall biosynthesis
MKNNYIIITPAKNEEKYIEKTILSVINQTVLPLKWVIVDDGSTDSTSDIVKKYLPDYPFIALVQKEKTDTRNFGNKVYAIRRGFEEVQDLNYDYYCNLDADVSFGQNYFEFLLKKLADNPRLGICGGRLYDLINGKFIGHKSQLHSVGGPIQFFRRECYESFGGYLPSPIGFIDGHAEISARMNGWQTNTFNEISVKHYRVTGMNRGGILKHRFQGGKIEYLFGYLYIYHIIRNLKTLFDKPFFLGYMFTLVGYHLSMIKQEERLVDKKFIKFVHTEQWNRIIEIFKRGKNGT